MKKKELFEKINELTEDYAKYCKDFNEKKDLQHLESVLRREHIIPKQYVGSAAMYGYLHKKNRNIMLAAVFYQSWYWNQTKIFFSFNETLEQEICNSDLSKTTLVPAILLNQCPYSSFFIQTNNRFVDHQFENMIDGKPDIKGDGLGFFAKISPFRKFNGEKFVNTGEKVLDVTCCAESNSNNQINTLTISMKIPVGNEKLSIQDAIVYGQDYDEIYDKEKAKLCKENDMNILLTALQYILHLCSKNSEITQRIMKKTLAISKKQKSNAKVKIYDVSVPQRDFISHGGYSHSGNHTNQTRGFHIRRAHWAFRWVGSKDNRHPELRWIRECKIHPELENKGVIVNVK